MNCKHSFVIVVLVTLLIGLAVGSTVLAQTSSNFDLTWHVIGGGGRPVASAHYVVNSTAGQGAASPPHSVSTSFAVSGGYWTVAPYRIYLPVVMRESG